MITKIDIPIYNTSVTVLVEIDEFQLKNFYNNNKQLLTEKEYNDLIEDIFKNKYPGLTLETDSHDYLIYLKNGASDNIVPHEIFHVCNKTLLNRNVSFDNDAEAWAYLIGWFTEEYYRRYWKFKDDNSKIETNHDNY